MKRHLKGIIFIPAKCILIIRWFPVPYLPYLLLNSEDNNLDIEHIVLYFLERNVTSKVLSLYQRSAYKSYGGSLCTDTEMAVHNTARKYHAMRTINSCKIKLYIPDPSVFVILLTIVSMTHLLRFTRDLREWAYYTIYLLFRRLFLRIFTKNNDWYFCNT